MPFEFDVVTFLFGVERCGEVQGEAQSAKETRHGSEWGLGVRLHKTIRNLTIAAL